MNSMSRVAAVLLLSACSGCVTSSMGPESIPATRLSYNEAISNSWDEQMLLNLVRLRYIESPLFVDVNGITAAYSRGGNASLGAKLVNGAGLADGNLGFGLDMRENPVVTYSYLQGEQFARRILEPISVGSIEPLTRSGWSMERLLSCCIQSIGEIENDAIDRERFTTLTALFGQLQAARQIRIAREVDSKTYLFYRSPEAARTLNAALGLDPNLTRVEVIDGLHAPPGKIAIQGRSLLAAMYVLSYGVDVPPSDRQKVAVLRDANGVEIDAKGLVKALMDVKAGDDKPNDAAVAIRLRNRWYWIAETDLESKNTLALMRMLLFLQSVERPAAAPVITIPSR